MRFIRTTIVVLALVVLLVAPRVANAEPPRSFFDDLRARNLDDRQLGSLLFTSIKGGGEFANSKARLSEQISAARRAFWASYPNGSDLDQKTRSFSELLRVKDFCYLQVALPEGINGKRMVGLDFFTGDLDSRISPGAMRAFADWVKAIRTELGAHGDKQLPLDALPRLTEAITKHLDVYLAYVLRRDMEEFRMAGKTFPSFTEEEWYFVCLFVRNRPPLRPDIDENHPFAEAFRRDPYAWAEEFLRDADRMFEPEHVASCKSKIMSAPKTSEGLLDPPLAAPEELGTWNDTNPYYAFLNLLGSGNVKNFMLSAIRKSFSRFLDPLDSEFSWSAAEARYNRLVEMWGADVIQEEGEKFRHAPKIAVKSSDGDHAFFISDQNAFGCGDNRMSVMRCFDRFVEANHLPLKAVKVEPSKETPPAEPKRGRRRGP